jgi:CheY-like chemotaxis protein
MATKRCEKYVAKTNVQSCIIIAITVKAIKVDKEMYIAAGANDYITRPVDNDRLVALMQLYHRL